MSERQLQPVRASRFWVPATCLVVIAVALTGLGLLMLSSLGSTRAVEGGNPLIYAYLQIRHLVVALICASVAFFVNLERLRRWVWWLYGGACFLMILVRVPGVATPRKGAYRWLDLGVIDLQVSELGKIALVLALAHYLANSQRFLRPVYFKWFDTGPKFPWLTPTVEARRDFTRGFVLPCCIIGGICGLIFIGPDLGTMTLCGAVGGVMLFVSRVRLYYLIPTAMTAIGALCVLVYNWPNRWRRIISFLDPEGTKLNEGYQLWQGMLAFACGGTTGDGLGQGMQGRRYLTEAHTDFIFAIVGEELGLVATSLVALGFLLFFLVVIFSLRHAHNLYQFNVCLGASLFVVFQALINMGVVIGMGPTKGISLPFISYGGTGLVTMFVMLALILNCLKTWARSPLMMPREL